MFLLFSGGGSSEVVPESETNPRAWGLVRKKAVAYLRMSGAMVSADLLSRLRFEHWAGTNAFGDQFDLLYLRVGVAKYLEMQRGADAPNGRRPFRLIADAMEQVGWPIRFIAVDMADDGPDDVGTPVLETTTEVVERALSDFEALLGSGGAVSAIDRVHTALHGYLIAVCRRARIQVNDGADIAALFNLLREQHPKFRAMRAGAEARKILRGLSNVVDAMNPVRNRGSMAHPNDALLEEPEAMLAANAVRSLLRYLNMKLG